MDNFRWFLETVRFSNLTRKFTLKDARMKVFINNLSKIKHTD